jgi:ribosomal protein S18 acetylase RimI-like enzyme
MPEGVVIRRLGPADVDAVLAASPLFDGPADRAATARFLAAPDHHLLMAFDGDLAVGFVSGVETTHPDKGTEMLLYELAVGEAARGRGIGAALVVSLRDLAVERGCYGMWVLTDDDNDAALATYRRAGAAEPTRHVMLDWTFGE